MSYHLKLTKGMSYSNRKLEATKRLPDVYVEDKADADAAVATGYFKLVEVVQDAHLDAEQLASLTVQQLKKMAKDMGVDISGSKDKDSIVAAITAETVIPGLETTEEETDSTENAE